MLATTYICTKLLLQSDISWMLHQCRLSSIMLCDTGIDLSSIPAMANQIILQIVAVIAFEIVLALYAVLS